MKSLLSNAIVKAKEEAKKPALDKHANTAIDEDIIKVLEESKAKIKVFGAGGAGGNAVNRMKESEIDGVELVAVNTDAQALINNIADKKILVGRKLTKGLGAGSEPNVGEAAAKESKTELEKEIKGSDLVFITCGMGGGTGTGVAPVIAEIAKENASLTIAVVTLPFTVEGRVRTANALEGLKKLRSVVDTVIVIPNDKILEIAPDLPLNTAFRVADEVLTNAVKGIAEMITKPGLINLDFADLRTIMCRGGAAMIGLGESTPEANSTDRALLAAENALTSPLLDIDISKAKRALVNVVGGTDMSIKEAQTIVEAVASKIDPEAHIIWGAMIDPEMAKTQIRAMIVIVGGYFPYIDGPVPGKSDKVKFKDSDDGELDDFDIGYTG
ncbi:MAG: cell division protein FtsZ [Candidatus ainarchaeum sp.]|nr:cell division protein FtsZ [Candidatus ainarchaeum sp.]